MNLAQRENPANWAQGREGENIIYTGYDQWWGHIENANIYKGLQRAPGVKQSDRDKYWMDEVGSWPGLHKESSKPQLQMIVRYPRTGLDNPKSDYKWK